MPALSSAQRAAFEHVEAEARGRQDVARARIAAILHDAGCAAAAFDAAMRSVRAHARVALHFHPDRLDRRGVTVADGLRDDGVYRNQFETGLSSGGRTAFPGGDRDEWERTLFGGAYHAQGVVAADRPKYGALALIGHPDGPTPRFGSCYVVLRPAVRARTTFTFAGSEQADAPERVGTIEVMDGVMAALLEEVARGQGAAVPWPPFAAPTLGVAGLTVASILDRLRDGLPVQAPDSSQAPGRVLDTCIEAQVHGPIDLRHDVERLVVDPSFAGTPTGAVLDDVCHRHGVEQRRHCGFRLGVADVPDDFRGPAMPRLARRIARDGVLDAAAIGAAEATLHTHPERWADWGSHDETLQHLKQLWHVLVHYGAPALEPR